MSEEKTRIAIEEEPELFTLDRAFSFASMLRSTATEDAADRTARFRSQELRQELFNFERVNRAVAFLLDMTAEGGGNEPLDENVALGLARLLEVCAGQIARTRGRIEKEFL